MQWLFAFRQNNFYLVHFSIHHLISKRERAAMSHHYQFMHSFFRNQAFQISICHMSFPTQPSILIFLQYTIHHKKFRAHFFSRCILDFMFEFTRMILYFDLLLLDIKSLFSQTDLMRLNEFHAIWMFFPLEYDTFITCLFRFWTTAANLFTTFDSDFLLNVVYRNFNYQQQHRTSTY